MSTLNVGTVKTDTIKTSADVEVYTCRAWVNFDGTGTVAIRASGNVSSITDNGTGDYTVNFTNAMPDANYAVAGAYYVGQVAVNVASFRPGGTSTPATTSSIRMISSSVAGSGAAQADSSQLSATIFR
jgi:hypothetical protein